MARGELSRSREVMKEHAYRLLAVSAILLLVIGTTVYRLLEDWSWVDSLYFSTVAVTTVGFGDLTPTSDGSKLFTVFYILSGITIITTYLNERLKVRAEARVRRLDSQEGSDDTGASSA